MFSNEGLHWLHCSDFANLVSTAPPAGHSHQLFHVCGVMATHFQIKAIQQDMVSRRHWLIQHSIPITFDSSVLAVLLCLVVNIVIVILYSLPLLSAPRAQKKKRLKDK